MVVGAQLTSVDEAGEGDVVHSLCPARDVVNHVTSKWGVWILVALEHRDLRFHQLRDGIEGISEKMLAQTLRTFVDDDLVWRHVEPTTPPQVTYGLTDFGREVTEPLSELFKRITLRLPDTDAAGDHDSRSR